MEIVSSPLPHSNASGIQHNKTKEGCTKCNTKYYPKPKKSHDIPHEESHTSLFQFIGSNVLRSIPKCIL